VSEVSFEMAPSSLRPGMATCRLDEDGAVEKFCPRCAEWWPATSEFFYRNAGKNPPLHSYCKSCTVDWQRERGLRGPPRRREVLS